MRPRPGDIYKHFKNKLYQIVTVATHSETKEELVIYQALYGDYKTYARPYDMFTSEVDHEKYPNVTQKYRFEKVNDISLISDETVTQIKEDNVNESVTKENNDGPDDRLMQFLEADTYSQKLELLNLFKKNIDDRLINAIAASLDTIVPEGDIEDRYISLHNFVKTQAKYECNRFR